MKTVVKKKFILIGLSIFMALLLGLAIFSYQATQKEQLLENIQNEALAELDERQGDYNEDTIVLSNTSHSQAESFAEKLNAKLRITQDGSFATLKLTDGRTIRDIYENDEYREYLSLFGIDYQTSISAIHDDGASEDGNFRHPEQPTSGYYNKNEIRDYLGYMHLENTWDYTKGNGVTVAIIDTGIDTDHSEFEGRISEYSYNATEDKIVKDWFTEEGSYDWSLIEDEQGHGTMVAGTIGAAMNGYGMTGIAPEVTLIVIKAECDEKGRFKSTADLVFGLYYAIERDVSVVNMSFGTYGANPFAEAAQLAYDSDIICVAAAGNEATASLTYPAADKNVIGVGALADDSWELASYSNYGENTNVVAPGTVYTASMGGKYKTANGTSFASPLVAGAVALFCSQNYYTTFDYLTEVLYASSYDLGDLGRDYYYGFGAVDVSAFILEERGILTYDMMTDELDDVEALFIRAHTLQEMLEPERLYAVFDGWYYDPHYVEEVVYYEDRFISDVTIYAKWVSEDDEIPFTYRDLEDGTIEITSYRGRRRFISVPEYIDGKLVSSIGAGAFAGETNLREVNLPSGLNNIGASAFSGCSNLTKIELPQKVKTIGYGAFSGDIRLSAVIFADNPALEYIGNDAFAFCSNLRRFEVPEKVTYLNGSAFFGTTAMGAFSVHKNNKNFVAEDGVLFNATKSTLIAYPANLTREYAVPNSVKTIDNCAFGYTRADSITLGKVQTIGGSAFQNSALTSIIIPDSVTTLGVSAFAYSSYLSEVSLGKGLTVLEGLETLPGIFECTIIDHIIIPNNIRHIKSRVFNCAAINTIEFETGSKLNSIGSYAFWGCFMQSLDLPKSLISIDRYAFSACRDLNNLTFENGSNLKTIGIYAFADTWSLTSVNLPNSLESIGDFAFMQSSLTGEIDIPEKVSYFGEGAFAACENLQSFDVADKNENYNDVAGVVYSEDGDCLVAYPTGNTNYEYYVLSGTEKIGGASFYGAAYVNYVYLNAEIVEIDDYAFAYASALYNMQIPENTVKIGRYSFAYTPSLYEISFSENAKIARLGYASLANSGIRTLRIPKNISTMAQGVFTGCSNLQNVTFARGNKLESISAYMFDGCENLYSITFEEGSALTSIQAHALEGMKNLQYIDFGDAKITNIDNFAFRFCEGFTSFHIPETVTNIGRYAFYYCKNLHEVTIPASVEHIGSYPFIGTNALEVYFTGERLPEYLDEDWDHGIKGYYIGVTNVVTEGDWQYATLASGDIAILKYTGNEKNVDLTNFTYGNVVTIGGSAFIFKGIESIILPNTLVTIQNEAFAYTKLTSVTIPASVEFIGREAFYKTTLQTLTFANNANVKVIEQGAFEKTENLQSITLPASLTTLGRAAFKNSGLTSVSFEDGIGLTQISKECFADSNITSITIPDSIIKIDDSAFAGCAYLETFNYGDQKLWLGAKAFYDSGLTEFTVSENLYVIEEFALTSLNNLTEFTVSENNAYYMGVDGLILLKDGSKLISVPAGRTGSLTLPQSVEKIGFGALEATELSEVIFPENQNLLCIANRAFFGAENLTQITIPSSVVSIDYYAFAYAKNLQTVLFEEGSKLTGVYEGAFYACNNLSEIVLPDTIVEISDFAFYGCDKLTKLPISETSGLKGIYSYAFAYTGLTELNLPANIIDIGDYAFMGCDLTSVVISAEKQYELLIGIGAFEGCNTLEYLEVPFIGASFEDTEISWFGYIFGAGAPEANQTYIPESLKTVKINGEITFIGNYAFQGVTSIDEVILPDTVDTLYYGAFLESTVKYELKQAIHLRENHYYKSTTLEKNYFGSGISGKIIIANDVTIIGESVFSGCRSLTSVIIPDSVKKIDSGAFSDCSGLTSVLIPNGVISIGSSAFGWCDSLVSIEIPASVTNIDNWAFGGSTNLYKIVNNSKYLSFDDYSLLKNSEEYGRLFYSAIQIIDNVKGLTHNLEDCFSYIETADGFGFIAERNEEGEITYKLIAYLGNKSTVTLPMGINDKMYQIYEMSGVQNVIIPEGITTIGNSAFSTCESLTSIVIPDSVTSIGDGAFYACSNLTSIIIPQRIINIGHSAFAFCESLTSIVIPNSVRSIGDEAFLNCNTLTTINLPDDITYIGIRAFSNSGIEKINIPPNNLNYTFKRGLLLNKEETQIIWASGQTENIVIPATITDITRTFEGFSKIKTVTFEDDSKLRTIGDNAFSGCSGLIFVALPESITNIGSYAFYECSSLTSISIPEKVISIGVGAFGRCISLTSIKLPAGAISIGDSAFNGCYSLSSIEIPNSVTSIGASAFSGCINLLSVNIPEGITRIENCTFDSCSSLTSIVIPNTVTSIGVCAFRQCRSLSSIELSDNLTSIEDLAFEYCGLTSIELPNCLEMLSISAFNGCPLEEWIVDNNPYFSYLDGISYNKEKTEILMVLYGVSEVCIPSTILNIEGAFVGRESLRKVTFEENSSITRISSAFQGCSSLNSIEIPNSVTSIDWFAFAGCGLTSIVIPESVTSIGDYSFIDCNNLCKIIINSEDLSFDEYASLKGTSEYGYLFAYAKEVVDNFRGVTHTLEEGFSYIDTQDGFRFMTEKDGDGKIIYKLIAYLGNEDTVTLPLDINGNPYQIYQMRGVKNVIIPEGIKEIGQEAFSGCKSLKSISIPDGVISIGALAFGYCSRLDFVEIPNSVTNIEDLAFYSCDNLKAVTFKEYSELSYLGGHTFWQCHSLASIIIPASVTYIGPNSLLSTAYYNNPKNWTKDGELYVNKHLIKVAEITEKYMVQSDVKAIAQDTFSGCYALKTLEIGGDHSGLLASLTNLETLILNDVPRHGVGKYFDGNANIPMTLKKIVLKKGVMMEEGAFSGISGVTIYVEDEEKDVRWDDNFPGWNNGNTVVYGDRWITANFYDHNGEVLSSEIFTTSQVIRVPYLKLTGDAQYSYIVEGFDIDGDGIVDAVPATSKTDIEARAIIRQVVNAYTVNFFDGDTIYHSVTLPYGSTIALPETPAKKGYTFLGWNGYAEGMMVNGNVNIYADWSHHGDGHVYDEPIAIEPTCEEQGYDKYTCTICGEWYGENYVDALGHDYTQSIVAPTCVEQGYTLYACDCGHSYKDNFVNETGHSFGEWNIQIAPTCEGYGLQVRVCAVCGCEEEAEILPNGHSFSEKIVRQATCEKVGLVVYSCQCGLSISEEIPVTEHDYKQVYASKSFLEWLIDLLLNVFYGYEGNQAYYFKCVDCGHIATENEVDLSYGASIKDVCVHNISDWAVLSEANCQTGTVYGKVCSLCDETIELKIDSTLGEHSYNKVVTAPTCTEQGYTTYTCHCGDSYVSDYVKETGHGYGEWYETKEATCLEKGAERRDCGNCDHYETREVVALGHDKVEHAAKAATCTEYGWNAYETCSRCDYTTYEKIPANGHDYGAVVTAPTCTEQGYTTYTCHCGDTYKADYVEALGHTEVIDKAVAATCTEMGLTEGKHCSVCGEVLVKQEEIPATGHSYGEWYETKAAKCEEKGAERRDCGNCDHYETREIMALGHSKVSHEAKAPTCTEIGWKVYETCTRCDYTTYEEISAMGHNHKAVVTAPTCTEQGYTTYTCHCGDTYEADYVEALGHTESDWIVDQEAAIGVKGHQHTECTVCGETMKEEDIPALEIPQDSSSSTKPETEVPDSNKPSDSSKPEQNESRGCFGSINNQVVIMLMISLAFALFMSKKAKIKEN